MFQEFHSFTWNIPNDDFSDKTVLEKVRNTSDFPLKISGRGLTERTLDPNSAVTISQTSPPAGEWVLKFTQPERRRVGEQRGETEEGITIVDIPRTAYLQFYVRNKETSPLVTRNK